MGGAGRLTLGRRAKILLGVALVFLVLGVCFGLASIYPVDTGEVQSKTIIDNEFHLGENEVRRQGLGAFQGNLTSRPEILTIQVINKDNFPLVIPFV